MPPCTSSEAQLQPLARDYSPVSPVSITGRSRHTDSPEHGDEKDEDDHRGTGRVDNDDNDNFGGKTSLRPSVSTITEEKLPSHSTTAIIPHPSNPTSISSASIVTYTGITEVSSLAASSKALDHSQTSSATNVHSPTIILIQSTASSVSSASINHSSRLPIGGIIGAVLACTLLLGILIYVLRECWRNPSSALSNVKSHLNRSSLPRLRSTREPTKAEFYLPSSSGGRMQSVFTSPDSRSYVDLSRYPILLQPEHP
ncbi:hypothetical protein BDQ12DRAFT_248303 [Crucibulum laeve]|uniref:Uncharacterized protein n=1 Tax=Crucibulum laeve TaxID=68775 RepID=A0A5C3LUX3_9AGAR|nr:hypothetical protein BDQ12DRAFT_248303 [Crucibulum laeve]